MKIGLRRLQKTTIVVHLLGGQSLQGILREVCRDVIILSHVTALDQGDDLAGDVLVPRDRVDFVQTVTTAVKK